MRRQAAAACLAILAGLAGLLQYTLPQVAIVSDLHRSRQLARLNYLMTVRNNRATKKSRTRKPRKSWIRPGRTSQWWDNFMNGVMLEEEWKENFRMSKCSFFKLCDAVRPFLVKQCTNMRMPVSVEKQVAVTLYYLYDEGRYRKVANAFGVAKSTVSVIARRVCTVISTVLGPQCIKLPKTENELEEAVQQFYSRRGFPQCFWCGRWNSHFYKTAK